MLFSGILLSNAYIRIYALSTQNRSLLSQMFNPCRESRPINYLELVVIKTKKIVFFVFCIVPLSFHNVYGENADAILGVWLNAEKDGYIEISKKENTFEGTIIGSPNSADGAERVDIHNPEPALRKRPLAGLKILQGFNFDGGSTWTGGQIYDPNNGKTYKCNLEFTDNGTMRVRGYIGIPLFGRTEIWTRKEMPAPNK